jgi:hypothetical protein
MSFNLSQIINRFIPVKVIETVETKTIQGGLVKIPFREGFYAVESSGSTAGFQKSGIHENEDGSDTGISVTVPAGKGNGVRIRFPFYGKALGVRWRRIDSACDFSVNIDGVSYGYFSGNHSYLINENKTGVIDGESLVIVADDLPEGTHYAEIMVSYPDTGNNAILFLGLLLESRVGYKELPRQDYAVETIAVPTVSTVIGKGSTGKEARFIKRIAYANTTASAITLTVFNNTDILFTKSIPANDSYILDLGNFTTNSYIKHQASASGLNSTVIGGY